MSPIKETIKKEQESNIKIQHEDMQIKEEEDDYVLVKHEDDTEVKPDPDSGYYSEDTHYMGDIDSEEQYSSEEEAHCMKHIDSDNSEDEDDAPPLDKKALNKIISNPRASLFNKNLAKEILSAHNSRTMTRTHYGGLYRRYICDTQSDGVVYDRRIGAVVKRLVPSPIGTFQVYDRLYGNIRPIRMIDGVIRNNEGIELEIVGREIEADHYYVPLDTAEEMVPGLINWDDMNLDQSEETYMDMEDMEDVEDDMEDDIEDDWDMEDMENVRHMEDVQDMEIMESVEGMDNDEDDEDDVEWEDVL